METKLSSPSLYETLLERFADQQRSENALSDLTWAACQTSPALLKTFLGFFFPGVPFDNLSAIEREYPEGDSRPDFLIRNGNDLYLIECKLYDTQHHFEQYTSTFGLPPARLGYITNYRMYRPGYTVRTWEELYHHLHRHLPADGEERKVWLAYLAYMKSVCSIYKKPKKMELKGMYSLYAFMQELKNAVNRETEVYKTALYESRRDTHGGGNMYGSMQDGMAGCYFQLGYKQLHLPDIFVWIGVYFAREQPVICLCFENKEGWGKPVCERLTEATVKSIPAGNYAGAPYYDAGSLWFDLSDERIKEFDASDLDRQTALLEAFIDEALRTVAGQLLIQKQSGLTF